MGRYDITISNNHISDSWIGIESRAPNTIITGNTITNWGQPNASTVKGVQRMQIAIYTTEMGSINTVISGNTLMYDAARWKGKVNGMEMYGFAICVTGLPDDTGRHEFENTHVIVSGNTIAPLPTGGSIGVGLALDAIGRPVPGGPTSDFFPATIRIENNAIVAPSEYQGVSISGSAVRTTAIVSGNSFGGGQKAPSAIDGGGNCDKPWLFYCLAGQNRSIGDGAQGLAGQLTASSFAALTVRGNTMAETIGASHMAFDQITGKLHVTGNAVPVATAPGGCFIPVLTNVSMANVVVESRGHGCASPVIIPVGTGGLEVTVWAEGGVFAKAVIVGTTLHEASQPAGATIVTAGAEGSSSYATLSTMNGKALSFSAVPLG